MNKIRNRKQFNESIDRAFDTQKTRDEAKACYDFEREEFKTAEAELCAYAAAHGDEVFTGRDAKSGWGATETVAYTITTGSTIERADGGKLSDAAFLEALPKKYLRVKREINKAKLKADGLDADDLAALGLVTVPTSTIRLAPAGGGDDVAP